MGRRLALRIKRQVRLLLDCVRAFAAAIGLLFAARSRSVAELWIGDSHAMCFNEERTTAELTRASEGQTVWHLGPRLMYSLAKDGFPRRVRGAARLLARMGRDGTLVPVFVAGEIDVRCHLVARSKGEDFDLEFVSEYVRRGCSVADAMGSRVAVFAVPPPPSATCPVLPEFPIVGTIEERAAMFMRLRSTLIKAVESFDGPVRAVVLDATDLLVDDLLGLRRDLTDDGCHTNARGVQLVRSRFKELALPAGARVTQRL